MRETSKDYKEGFADAVRDVLEWHAEQVELLNEKISEAFVTAPGERKIQIGVVWEGKHCSADQLHGLMMFHTECLKVLKEKFDSL